MFGMPGPWSRAMTEKIARPWSVPFRSTISPCPAYKMMFLASSEMAVVIRTRSVEEKPIRAAISLPLCRARTISASDPILTRSSRPMPLGLVALRPELLVQVGEPLLEAEGRRHPLHGESELNHREGHLGLAADDDRLGPPQPDHLRDVPGGARGERVHHVESGDIYDHPP